jgi:hypothetical protein
MLATMKHENDPRGIDQNTEFYGFYVRATGETRELIREARRRLTGRYGAPPSNPLLLRELLRLFVTQGGSNEPRAEA